MGVFGVGRVKIAGIILCGGFESREGEE